ncbi:peptidoglycan-binding domain-containing protein [Bradyrhizobium sp. ARR65]|uniref:peptidoglycan-binding domain-containing protein n=1 Tax=Bradyrhizobium sp. ARR65 TaxID=1040989 RepID=UPI000AD8A654|nr:peptidoglycan-binding domain-containing protein [Bradyrhizobium sp. ARR65]
MRKIAIALLASTATGTPAIAASNNQQQPQTKQMQPQTQGQVQPQNNAQQNAQSQGNSNQQQAQNDQISPHNLSRGEIRQVQQALDKNGFSAGPTDGRWGRETENAAKQFQQSKQIQANGQLDQQTVADLGLDVSRFSQSQGGRK